MFRCVQPVRWTTQRQPASEILLLVRPPSRPLIIEIFRGVLDDRHSREEVASWYRAVTSLPDFTPLTVANGHWYFESLAALDIPMAMGDSGYFVRERDIEEYIADLNGIAASDHLGEIARIRVHELPTTTIFKPLLMFDQPNYQAFDELGLISVRGIFDPHLDLVEHIHLRFEDQLYLFIRQYDDQARSVMVLGTERDQETLDDLLSRLGMA